VHNTVNAVIGANQQKNDQTGFSGQPGKLASTGIVRCRFTPMCSPPVNSGESGFAMWLHGPLPEVLG